eukprot:TRINITY_DN3241_c0_g1_i1.p1 TRINITY_DN3241_c0_g1~~TRINITY_DN3241_c0_g1_i1.p1  ORF type:complete len:652 (-),score=88.60 TRINITY_DN3241_c0_g1_i1:68-2023(-)
MGQQTSSCCGSETGTQVRNTLSTSDITDIVADDNLDSKVKWETDAHGNKISLLSTGLATDTEINMLKFPMYAISMETLMQLDVMKTHEDMRGLGQVRKIPKTAVVHFVSHQWVGNTVPDPRGVQLGRLQNIFRQILNGHARELFTDEDWLTYTQGAQRHDAKPIQDMFRYLTSLARTQDYSEYTDADYVRDLMADIESSYVWLDYASIPQAVAIDGVIANQILAVRSIPAYAERANYFWILAPSELHADTGLLLNFQTWSTRGWCRLEEWSNCFSPNAKMPLIITDSAKLSTKSSTDYTLVQLIPGRSSPFTGEYSCCRMNHKVKLPSGDMLAIPCDKPTVAAVMKGLWDSRLSQLENAQSRKSFLIFAHVLVGLAAFEGTQFYGEFQPQHDESEEQFMSRMKNPDKPFTAETFEMGDGGPAHFAALNRDPDFFAKYVAKNPGCLELTQFGGETALIALCHFKADVLRSFLRLVPDLAKTIHIASPSGRTALDKAAWCGHNDTAELLLEIKADFNALRTDTGRTPLLTAAAQGYQDVCNTLMKWRASPMTRETKSGRTALHIAATSHIFLVGSQEARASLLVAEAFLHAKSDIHATDSDGMTPLDLAMQNHHPSLVEYFQDWAQDNLRRVTRAHPSAESDLAKSESDEVVL